jgi:hypothetical protein
MEFSSSRKQRAIRHDSYGGGICVYPSGPVLVLVAVAVAAEPMTTDVCPQPEGPAVPTAQVSLEANNENSTNYRS